MTKVKVYDKYICRLNIKFTRINRSESTERYTQLKYRSRSTYHTKVLAKIKVFITWVNHQGQDKIPCYPWKDFATRNTHVKYQSPITYHSKVIAKESFLADDRKE
jgi:hypothetical protein